MLRLLTRDLLRPSLHARRALGRHRRRLVRRVRRVCLGLLASSIICHYGISQLPRIGYCRVWLLGSGVLLCFDIVGRHALGP
jgi:hypothetical protein